MGGASFTARCPPESILFSRNHLFIVRFGASIA